MSDTQTHVKPAFGQLSELEIEVVLAYRNAKGKVRGMVEELLGIGELEEGQSSSGPGLRDAIAANSRSNKRQGESGDRTESKKPRMSVDLSNEGIATPGQDVSTIDGLRHTVKAKDIEIGKFKEDNKEKARQIEMLKDAAMMQQNDAERLVQEAVRKSRQINDLHKTLETYKNVSQFQLGHLDRDTLLAKYTGMSANTRKFSAIMNWYEGSVDVCISMTGTNDVLVMLQSAKKTLLIFQVPRKQCMVVPQGLKSAIIVTGGVEVGIPSLMINDSSNVATWLKHCLSSQ